MTEHGHDGSAKGGQSIDPEDLRSLGSETREAIKALELHHVAEIDYVEADGERDKIRFEPGYIRHNKARHIVAWGMAVGTGHPSELLIDGIKAVRDTGEVFTPAW